MCDGKKEKKLCRLEEKKKRKKKSPFITLNCFFFNRGQNPLNFVSPTHNDGKHKENTAERNLHVINSILGNQFKSHLPDPSLLVKARPDPGISTVEKCDKYGHYVCIITHRAKVAAGYLQ